MERKAWTTEEVEDLQRLSTSSSSTEIAEKLDRPLKMIRYKAKQLGITLIPGQKGKVLWTPDRIAELADAAATYPRTEVAEQFGLTVGGLADVMFRYDIKGRGLNRKQTPEEVEARISKLRGVQKVDRTQPRKCSGCGEVKGPDEFYTQTDKSKLDSRCKECKRKERNTRWENNVGGQRDKESERRANRTSEERDAHLLSQREYILRTRFNMTVQRYTDMFENQGGKCAICHRPETKVNPRTGLPIWLAIDHDHACCPESGKSCGKCIRGLLCADCNTILGKIELVPGRELGIAEYLKSE